ncbi:putative zinc-binding protein [Methanogenium sp. MK-MG]|nr:putative zinc-binding protein [Methanogenium sp. MK-MG]
MAADLGIEKKKSREYTDKDIETVVSAVWEGKGRTE